MIYFHPDAIPEGHWPEFRVHMPTYRDPAGHLHHGACCAMADSFAEARAYAKAENTFLEGHYVTDSDWNIYHV